MYLENMQKYNTFIYKVDTDINLKSLLLDKMHFSIRQSISIKNGDYSLSIDGKTRPKDGIIKKDSIVKIVLSDEKSEYQTQEKDLEILYEDEDLLIIDKPAFMVVHPTKSHLQDTLLNYVQGYFEKQVIKSKVRFVSRLDRDTSGIITIAKNAYSHYALSQGFLSNKIQKYYTAITKGYIKDEKGSIRFKIAKSDDGIKRIVSEDGQNAVTHYKIIYRQDEFSIVELLLETGRTHQIRVHLGALGNHIIGDELYDEKSLLISRQALHCSKIELISPRSMKKIMVKSKLPQDIKNLLKSLNYNRIEEL